jgi:hypothetical protein
MPEVIVVLVTNSGNTQSAVLPHKVPVPTGLQTITWQSAGPNSQFPAFNYFWWKTEPAPLGGAIPSRSPDGKTLSVTYSHENQELWEYGVTITNGPATVEIDPEIDNRPPGTDPVKP